MVLRRRGGIHIFVKTLTSAAMHHSTSSSDEEEEEGLYWPTAAEHASKREAEVLMTAIWSAAFQAKITLQEEKLKEKFEPGDKEKICNAVDDVLDLLERVQNGSAPSPSKDEVEAMKKELEDVVSPIMYKVMMKVSYRSW